MIQNNKLAHYFYCFVVFIILYALFSFVCTWTILSFILYYPEFYEKNIDKIVYLIKFSPFIFSFLFTGKLVRLCYKLHDKITAPKPLFTENEGNKSRNSSSDAEAKEDKEGEKRQEKKED